MTKEEFEIESKFQTVIQQRDRAHNEVVMLSGEIAKLKYELEELKKAEDKGDEVE